MFLMDTIELFKYIQAVQSRSHNVASISSHVMSADEVPKLQPDTLGSGAFAFGTKMVWVVWVTFMIQWYWDDFGCMLDYSRYIDDSLRTAKNCEAWWFFFILSMDANMIKHVSAAQCNSLLILLTCHSVQQNNSQYGSRAYRSRSGVEELDSHSSTPSLPSQKSARNALTRLQTAFD